MAIFGIPDMFELTDRLSRESLKGTGGEPQDDRAQSKDLFDSILGA